jgi:hypothetical protein
MVNRSKEISMRNVFIVLIMLVFSAVSGWTAEDTYQIIHPEKVMTCLKNPKAVGLTVLTDINPYYLRGDFDGDGKVDYALQVRSKKSSINGLLICAGNGSLFLLGSGIGGSLFTDVEDDNFTSSNWSVYTKEDVAALASTPVNVPHPIPAVKGESIEMLFEAEIDLIYWDGKKFRWAGAKIDN